MRQTTRIATASLLFIFAGFAVKQLAARSIQEGRTLPWLGDEQDNAVDESQALVSAIRRLEQAREIDSTGWFLSAVNSAQLAVLAESEQRLADLDPALAQSVRKNSEKPIQEKGGTQELYLPNLPRVRLLEASRLSPQSSWIQIKLGLQAEAAGDLQVAEQHLLSAARVDRQYLPAWTLTNYYYRRGDGTNFRHWSRIAIMKSFDGYAPLIRLMDTIETTPSAVLTQAGGGAPFARAYLDFLIGTDRLLDAELVARRLIETSRQGILPERDRARVTALVDRPLKAGNVQPAWALWNDVRHSGNRVQQVSHESQEDPILSNTKFQRFTSGIGFDWTLHHCDGVQTNWQPGHLDFEWVGLQESNGATRMPIASCVLAEQPVLLDSGSIYQLQDELEMIPGSDVGSADERAGDSLRAFRWSLESLVRPQSGRNHHLPPSSSLFQNQTSEASGAERTIRRSLKFEPVYVEAGVLRLSFLRIPGEVPFRGSLRLRSVQLSAQPPAEIQPHR
ncbi:MAG: hypothetical protein ABI824_14675 [Acidobacteriota bacterium]